MREVPASEVENIETGLERSKIMVEEMRARNRKGVNASNVLVVIFGGAGGDAAAYAG
jgi:hypothetical protein